MQDSLLKRFDCDEDKVRSIVAETVQGADDGELFLEYSESEALMFDNGRLKTANFNTEQGFGLRAVAGEATGYAHSSELSQEALLRAADAVSAVKAGYSGTLAEAPPRTNRHLYGEENPTGSPSFEGKAKLLQEIDAWSARRGSARAPGDRLAGRPPGSMSRSCAPTGRSCATCARWCA